MAAPQRAAKPMRVLLAEDNLVNQVLAIRILERRGHTVKSAKTGLEALACIECENFDVLITDMQMPDMDGFETAAAIRERERETGGHLPIIAMTAMAMKGDRERCLSLGMDGYISKPMQQHELFEVIEKFAPAS
jgi:CheY-like chemotaxis protein